MKRILIGIVLILCGAVAYAQMNMFKAKFPYMMEYQIIHINHVFIDKRTDFTPAFVTKVCKGLEKQKVSEECYLNLGRGLSVRLFDEADLDKVRSAMLRAKQESGK